MKHYKSIEILSVFRVSSRPAQTQSLPAETQSPPIENFLATFLCQALPSAVKAYTTWLRYSNTAQTDMLWLFFLWQLTIVTTSCMRISFTRSIHYQPQYWTIWCDHSNTTSLFTNLNRNEINTVYHAITHTRSRDLEAWSVGCYIKRTGTN